MAGIEAGTGARNGGSEVVAGRFPVAAPSTSWIHRWSPPPTTGHSRAFGRAQDASRRVTAVDGVHAAALMSVWPKSSHP